MQEPPGSRSCERVPAQGVRHASVSMQENTEATDFEIIQVDHAVDPHHLLPGFLDPRFNFLVYPIARALEGGKFRGIHHSNFIFRLQVLLNGIRRMETLEQGRCVFAAVLNDDLCPTRMVVDKVPN
jgi:hypothetical protein